MIAHVGPLGGLGGTRATKYHGGSTKYTFRPNLGPWGPTMVGVLEWGPNSRHLGMMAERAWLASQSEGLYGDRLGLSVDINRGCNEDREYRCNKDILAISDVVVVVGVTLVQR